MRLSHPTRLVIGGGSATQAILGAWRDWSIPWSSPARCPRWPSPSWSSTTTWCSGPGGHRRTCRCDCLRRPRHPEVGDPVGRRGRGPRVDQSVGNDVGRRDRRILGRCFSVGPFRRARPCCPAEDLTQRGNGRDDVLDAAAGSSKGCHLSFGHGVECLGIQGLGPPSPRSAPLHPERSIVPRSDGGGVRAGGDSAGVSPPCRWLA